MADSLIALLIIMGLGVLGGVVRYLLALGHHDAPLCVKQGLQHSALGMAAALTVGVSTTWLDLIGWPQHLLVACACLSSQELLTWAPRVWRYFTGVMI